MNIIELAAERLETLYRSGVPAHLLGGIPAPKAGPKAEVVRPVVAAKPQRLDVADRPRRVEPRRTLTLDLEALHRSGHVAAMQTRSALAEEFRFLKRPLLHNIRDAGRDAHRRSLIMVTSAVPGEGKTFCAINLAFSLAAEIDTSVLLVDADVVHPRLLWRLGVAAPQPGLLDLLGDPRIELADVLLKTNVPKLTLLPAGAPTSLSTELLASAAMRRLLDGLLEKAGRQVVVFDAPPLLVTNEAAVLASQVGQVLMVVAASQTPAPAVEQAFALLAQHETVLSVLNKGRKPALASDDGYYDDQSSAQRRMPGGAP